MISTYPKQWIQKYCNNHYQRIDPTVLLCHKLDSPFSWQLGRQLPGDDIAQYWEEAAGFNLAYGISIPLEKTTLHSAGIGISLDTQDDTQWLAEHQAAINVLSHLFHFKLNQLQSCTEHNIQEFGLSIRELECAHWLCTGLPFATIAERMAITERTVRFHLQQLKRKLNCKNKEQVIAQLISMKLVQV